MREGDTSPTTRVVTISGSGDVDSAIRAYIQQVVVRERKDLPRPYFAFPYGLAADESDFAFLADPSQVDLAYEFASIANSVPDFNAAGRWSFTDNQIDGHYASWLDFSVSAPIAIDPRERQRLREARAYCADHFETYWTHFFDYYNALDELEACESIPAGHRTPEHERTLRRNAQRVDHALLAWEVNGRKSDYERQHALSEDLARRDPAFAKRELRQAMGAPIVSGRGDFFWTSLVPSDAFANHNAWSPHEITFEQADFAPSAGTPTLSLLSTQGRELEHAVLEDLPVAGTRIAFEMARLVIDRSWFMSLLLSSRNWKWASSTQDDPTGGDPLSDGQSQPTGKLVMIPREILFIRNKRIENPALSRRLAAQPTIDRTASLSFGPFGLQPRAGAERPTEPSEDGACTDPPPMVTFDLRAPSTVVASHMEYLAFVCELLPRTPDPNWMLWQRG